MKDIEIIHTFTTKDQYLRFKPYIKSYLLGSEAATIYRDIAAWYDEGDSVAGSTKGDVIDWEEFASWFKFVRHSMFKPEKMEIYNKIFNTLITFTPSATSEAILKALIERDAATQIADKALAISDGDSSVDMNEIGHIYDQYLDEIDYSAEVDSWIMSESVSELLSDVYSDEGYSWPLPCLNENLRPLRPGMLILLSARPNSGKTTFAAQIATHVAGQTTDNNRIIWFNNDQYKKAAMARIVQSAVGWEEKRMKANTVLVEEEYTKAMNGMTDRIQFIDKRGLSIYDVERVLKRFEADGVSLIIFDQLWKLHGFEGECGKNEPIRQSMLFGWAREICDRAPLIAVHQADGTAEGEKWITQGQLHMSKVGAPGEADTIITLGRNPNEGNVRGLHIAKSKCNMTHDKHEIILESDIGRFRMS